MLFTQQDLQTAFNGNIILDEAIYIDHNTISPNTTSVVVNEDLNVGIVRFSDVEAISEEYGCDYIDAMIAIAESNDIDPTQIAVAIDEAEIIENPYIVYELDNVVINPISENSLAYIFCESMIDAYIDTEDEEYLYGIIDEGFWANLTGNQAGRAENKQNLKNLQQAQKNVNTALGRSSDLEKVDVGQSLAQDTSIADAKAREKAFASQSRKARLGTAAALGALGVAAYENSDKLKAVGGRLADRVRGSKSLQKAVGKAKSIGGKISDKLAGTKTGQAIMRGVGKAKEKLGIVDANAIAKEAEGKPKRWISRKIAALRGLYQKYLEKARQAGPNASMFQKVARQILGIIDKLMAKLENMTA